MRNRLLLLAAVLAIDLSGMPGVSLAQGNNAQQSPTLAKPGSEIPAKVQGWADAAIKAYERGDPVEALQLQLQVSEWLSTHVSDGHSFRAKALSNLGFLLHINGRPQEGLMPTREAVSIYRELGRIWKTSPLHGRIGL